MKIRAGLIVLTLAGCAGAGGDDVAVSDVEMAAVATDAVLEGESLFQANCASCHTLQGPPTLAPPMSHVAQHYRTELTDRAEFIARIVAWVPEPSEERSLMPAQAVQRFGLMPAQRVSASDLGRIAAWIYTLEPDSGSMGMEGAGGMGMGGMPGMAGPDSMPHEMPMGAGRGMGGGGMPGGMAHDSMGHGMPMDPGRMNHGAPADSAG